ncbi:MAG: PIN domain-containing protein [Candidatus Methanoperedens sp.]|nr:PIN domain-containing protein [Candidatus Methanoperedens sp.]
MKQEIIPPDSDIFIDSNIFTYHLLGHKRYRDSVKDFLIKIESGIYTGYINDVVVSEVYHNFIRVKICDKFNIQTVDFIRFIKSNPEAIAEVDMSKVTAILSMKNIQFIHGIKIDMVEENMKKYNLLSSDAIHVSSCNAQNIEYMATNDSDFERVDFLNLWMP